MLFSDAHIREVSMKYTISLSGNQKYIIVYVDGPMTTELAIIVGKEAKKLASDHDVESLLYDLRKSRNVQNGFKNYEFGYRDVETVQFNKSFKIALLTSPDDQSHDFIETVMINNGYNVRIFKTEEDALDWLTN